MTASITLGKSSKIDQEQKAASELGLHYFLGTDLMALALQTKLTYFKYSLSKCSLLPNVKVVPNDIFKFSGI